MTAYKILDDKVVFTLGTPSGWTAATLQQGIDAARRTATRSTSTTPMAATLSITG
jgi:hypothetical protein